MLCVYLDWNIFANFRDWKLKGIYDYSKYKALEDLKNSGQIKTYFSDAHLLDLMPKSDDSQFLPNDLKSITQLTDDYYIVYDAINHKEYKCVVDPHVVYVYTSKNFTMNHSFETVRKSCGHLGPLLFKLLLNMKVSTVNDNNSETKETDLKSDLDKLFMEHNKALNDSKFFKSKREYQLKQLQTIPSFRTLLSGNSEQKLLVFSQIFPALLSSLPPEMKNRSDLCLSVFMLLDQLHLWTDRVYKNMMIDALHAFYASNTDTDFLITNDNNFREKAIIAFHVLGIELPVLNFDEFLDVFKITI